MNEEFEGNRDTLNDWQENESSTAESVKLITEQEVKVAIEQMKKGKAAGPSGVTAKMLQAAGEAGIRWVTEICNAILKEFQGTGNAVGLLVCIMLGFCSDWSRLTAFTLELPKSRRSLLMTMLNGEIKFCVNLT